MSALVIATLSASAETPGMPPCVIFEPDLADTTGGLVPATADFTPADCPQTGLAETGVPETGLPENELSAPEQTGLVEPIAAEPLAEGPVPAADESLGADPDLWFYRKRTIGLLRRYMRLSIAVGRMPSLLGREFFRTRVTSYKSATFEDSVIFVHDVERCLEKLNEFDKKLIAKIVLQEYSQEEAGRQLGWGLRHTARSYAEALDKVTETFLKRALLTRLPCPKVEPEKSCQGGKSDEFLLSDSEQAENKCNNILD